MVEKRDDREWHDHATASLLILLLISASFGWNAAGGTAPTGEATYSFPPVAMIGIIVGFIAVIASSFKPMLAKFLGSNLSHLATALPSGLSRKGTRPSRTGSCCRPLAPRSRSSWSCLVLYRTQIIKVTDKFRRSIIFATLGIAVLYGVSFLMSLFGASISFINSPSLFGIGFSVVVCVVAAMNLALDFDRVEKGVAAGMPKTYEWVSAIGLLVTLVWLYLEMLRLLSKLQSR